MRHLFFVVILFNQFLFAAEKMVIRISDPSPSTVTRFVKDDYDIAAYKPGEYLDIVVTDEQASDLSSEGYDFRTTQTETQLKENLGDIRDLAGYRTYEETLNELQSLEESFPGICKLYDIGDTWGKEYDEGWNPNYVDYNHEIWALKLSDNVDETEDEPNVYFLGVHHAREPISNEVVMAILNNLVNNYGTDTDITDRINNTQIWFVPIVNPNGHRVVTEQIDVWWRKNIRDNNLNGSFDTYNSWGYGTDGVDPNRNYGFMWGNVGASDDFDDPTYHGPEAWSEPEVSAVRGLLESNHFVAGITYHSYGELVLYPFGYQNNMIAPDQIELAALAEDIAGAIPGLYGGYYTPEAGYDLYPCMGTTDDYSYGEHGTFSFTVELATEFIPPSYQVDPICNANLEAANILMSRVDTQTLTGQITDASSGAPIVANIFVDGIDNTGVFRHPYQSDSTFGRYYRFLPGGNFEVTFTSPGYLPVVMNAVPVSPFGQTVIDTQMEPAQLVTLTGQIFDAVTNLPIDDAIVELLNTVHDPVATDVDGYFSFEQVYENIYSINIQREGYSSIIEEIFVTVTDHDFSFYLSPSTAESFETGEFTSDWSFSGHANWMIVNTEAFDGIYSARSGNISDNQFSELIFEASNSSDGFISFYQKISTESGYDFLTFYIDDVQIDQWAGELDWEQVSYPINAGNHVYRWSYVKDTYVSDGQDCVWLDYIELPLSDFPPNLVIDPSSIEIESLTDQVTEQSIFLSNIGGEIIEYQLSVSESWMNINAVSGQLSPDETDELTLTVNTLGMITGSYSGFVHILSNDPDEPSVYLNVTLTINADMVDVNVAIEGGWNLVGLPAGLDDTDVFSVYPTAVSGTLFGFDDGYLQKDSLDLGVGYWLRFDEGVDQMISGNTVNSLSVSLSEGWNLISGVSLEVADSLVIDPDSILVPNTNYGFGSSGYYSTHSFVPGKANWIRAYEDGEVIISSGITLIDHVTSDCLELDRDASLNLEVNGNMVTLFVSHSDLNCCLIAEWNGWLEDNLFHVEMNDVGPPCDCNCAFDLSATFGPFEPGTYSLDFWPELFGNPSFTVDGRSNEKFTGVEWNTITTDGLQLLFGSSTIHDDEKLQFSLPPKPPIPATDIRFEGNSRLCDSEDCTVEVSMSENQMLSLDIQINDGDHWELVPWYGNQAEWGNVIELTHVDHVQIHSDVTQVIVRKKTASDLPSVFLLHHAYPNPFNPVTTISFSIPQSENFPVTSLKIYDLTGRLVQDVFNEIIDPGHHSIQWNASGFSSGVYFSVLQHGQERQISKMLLLK